MASDLKKLKESYEKKFFGLWCKWFPKTNDDFYDELLKNKTIAHQCHQSFDRPLNFVKQDYGLIIQLLSLFSITNNVTLNDEEAQQFAILLNVFDTSTDPENMEESDHIL